MIGIHGPAYQCLNIGTIGTPSHTEAGRDSTYSRLSIREILMIAHALRNYYNQSSMEPSRMTTDSRDEPSVSISNASEVDSEWIVEDEPGEPAFRLKRETEGD
nr:protein BREVIS RADIX-like [Ipomoea batatas]